MPTPPTTTPEARISRLVRRLRVAIRWRVVRGVDRVGFELFRGWSSVRYGHVRQISGLTVRSVDYRSWQIFKAPNSELPRWRTLLELSPELVIDVGANYGEFAAASTSPLTLAIEASPSLIPSLEQTFHARPDVRVIHAAVTDHDGSERIHEQLSYSGFGSLFPAVARHQAFYGQRYRRLIAKDVPALRLDTLLEQLSLTPRSIVLKIDVEGAEPKVLAGATKTLARCQWWRALVEWNPRALAAAGVDIPSTWANVFAPRLISGAPDNIYDIADVVIGDGNR